MKVYIEKLFDYTLKRKGEKIYSIVEENGEYVKGIGCCGWKTQKACMNRINELGYQFCGVVVKHQNYSHWADFQFAK